MEQGGFGYTCKITVNSGLVAIAGVEDMGIPEFEKVVAEITGHDAPGGYAKFISTGKRKMNAFTLKVVWDPTSATHAALKAAFDSDDAVAFELSDAEGLETISFDAIVTKMGRVSEQEEGYKCEIEIQPTGQPTIA